MPRHKFSSHWGLPPPLTTLRALDAQLAIGVWVADGLILSVFRFAFTAANTWHTPQQNQNVQTDKVWWSWWFFHKFYFFFSLQFQNSCVLCFRFSVASPIFSIAILLGMRLNDFFWTFSSFFPLPHIPSCISCTQHSTLLPTSNRLFSVTFFPLLSWFKYSHR